MAFAMCPDDGLPRIYRYLPRLLGPNIVSYLDAENNILRISRENFDKLSPMDKHQVLRTHQPTLEIIPQEHGYPLLHPNPRAYPPRQRETFVIPAGSVIS